MDREKKITPITAQDIQAVINSSVMGEGNRLVGNATEQKQILVRPIANTDNKPNVMSFIQRVADEAEKAIEEVAEKSADISTEGLQPSIDEALETASKTIVGAINELRRQLAKATVLELTEVVSELPKVGEPNKFYLIAKETTDANDLYDEWIWVNKGTKDNPDYKWEYTGAKKIEFNADEYVKFTDYATTSKAGVIKSSKAYGFLVNQDGLVWADTLRSDEYKEKAASTFIGKGTLENIKYTYVRGGLVDNTETLTDEEKTSACDWIGAIKKLPSLSTPFLYLQLENGTMHQSRVSNLNYNPASAIFRLQQAGETTVEPNGTTVAKIPKGDWDCTPKKYVDQNKGTKLYLHEFYDAWSGNTLFIITNSPYEIEPHNIQNTFNDYNTIAAKINGRPCLDIFTTGEGIKCFYLNEMLGVTWVEIMLGDGFHDEVTEL